MNKNLRTFLSVLIASTLGLFSAVSFANEGLHLLRGTIWTSCSVQPQRPGDDRQFTRSVMIQFAVNGTFEMVQQLATFSSCPRIPIQPNSPSIESTIIQNGTYRVGDAVDGVAGAQELDLSINSMNLRVGSAMNDDRRVQLEQGFGISLNQPGAAVPILPRNQTVDEYIALRVFRTRAGSVLQMTSGDGRTTFGLTPTNRAVDFGTAVRFTPATTRFEILTIQN